MKTNNILFMSILIIFASFSAFGQSIFGKWQTIDDETGETKSIVEIYQENGKAYSKILQVLTKGKENSTCEKCSGNKKNQPIKGMQIINGLTQDGNEWNDGKILDPESGKEYKCYLELESPNKLKVRGYIGFSLIGRTQYWKRM